jgi:hypothetical protein
LFDSGNRCRLLTDFSGHGSRVKGNPNKTTSKNLDVRFDIIRTVVHLEIHHHHKFGSLLVPSQEFG